MTSFRHPDVVPNGAFAWTMELRGGDDAHWALRMMVIRDESLQAGEQLSN